MSERMHVFAQLPRWYTRWLNCWRMGTNPIGALSPGLIEFILEECYEHIGCGVVVIQAAAVRVATQSTPARASLQRHATFHGSE